MLSIAQIKAAIKSAAPHVEVERIPLDMELQESGIDSLEYFNIIVELQTVANLEIPDEDIDGLNTINSIHTYFKGKV